jgi:methyltransferase (TIGR00027 family)
MMKLSEVSQTAILVLISRVVESEKKNPVFNDPMAVLCLERLLSLSSQEERRRILRWKQMYAGINARDARARVLMARNFDNIASLYISNNPGCTIINLACGLDTRYWRINTENCKYIELDLPEMIELKRKILKDYLNYELISCSVLDTSWINRVTSKGNSGFLLIAEGLLYYLPKEEVSRLLKEIARKFDRSQLVLDMAHEKYTTGIWKRLISLESRVWDIDVTFVFGINKPRDIESFGTGFKVIGNIKGNVGPIITVSINAGWIQP